MAGALLVLKFFALAYGALLPVINPLGSALMFLAVVGSVPPEQFRHLARRVSVSMVLFLLAFEGGGAALLNFFGISLPVVQFAGGFVLAAMGWRILDQNESANGQRTPQTRDMRMLDEKIFFPLTFPISAGPACIVVTLTLSAHASRRELISNVLGHFGMALAIVALGVTLWLCYAYAPRITQKIAPATVQGILRVVAFVLLCIGVQIASNGLEAIVKTAREPQSTSVSQLCIVSTKGNQQLRRLRSGPRPQPPSVARQTSSVRASTPSGPQPTSGPTVIFYNFLRSSFSSGEKLL